MSANSIQFQLPKLNGKNYNNWSIQLKVFFRSQNLWDVVEDGYADVDATRFEALQKAEKDSLIETRKRDQKALYTLFQAVEEVIFEKISAAETSHEAWAILKKAYKGDDRVKRVRLQTLRADFESLHMNDSEGIASYFDRVQSIVNQIRANGEKLEDQRVVEKILRSLTVRFDYVVAAIEESQDTSTMSLDRLLGSLSSHEQRMNQKAGNSNPEQALQSSYVPRKRGGSQSHGRGSGQGGSRGGRNSFSGKRDKSKVKCYNCQQLGHFKSECPCNNQQWKSQQVHVVEASDE